MRYSEVFVPGGFPRHTYNPRTNRNLESRISEVADNLCKLSTVTGHTKSGKTVLVRNAYPPEESIWIDGGTVGDEEDFWSAIIGQLELFQSTEEGSSTERSSEIGAEGTAEANFLVTKGSGALSGKLGDAHGTAKSGTRTVSSRVAALAGLRNPESVFGFT